MEYANELWLIVWEFIKGTFSNPANLAILVVAWALIEALSPLFAFVVSLPKVNKSARLQLHNLVKKGKQQAAVFWCAVGTWVPYSQPELCGAELTEGCQTIMDRLAVAVVLGYGMSVIHWFIAPKIRKALGNTKMHRITCSNCRKGVKVSSLDDPCPICGEIPHEVTSPQ